ncbi:hypothetical protein [Faecalibacter bovis]|uniref:Phage major capsid protein n=1 Tax=Faecalibacter bovis TaxID=2898187 RepID=A0ABX7XDQ1_9FLAO|nr:hypothetical protein [Faecalibacter bovis]QTV06051.1 hypothetical protein J9309_01500 [Faecalibacter bovis]
MAGVYREIWTGELVEGFRPFIEASFLNTIQDYSEYVSSSRNGENQVIHLVDIGADPEVLINNTSYPIGYSEQVDGDLAFNLDKYQTKATKVTDDELYAITYDKIAKVNDKHRKAILTKKFGKAIHALAPASNTTDTPVIGTTGATESGQKVATLKDLISLAKAMTDAGVPNDGNRVLVLDDTHLFDLLKEDTNLYKNYVNVSTGQLLPLLYGFKVYTYGNNPFYAGTTKASYGAVFNPSTHSKASVAFYAPDMFRAEGKTKMYYDEPDTQTQSSAVNFRHYYLIAPKKARAMAALVTSKVSG